MADCLTKEMKMPTSMEVVIEGQKILENEENTSKEIPIGAVNSD